MLKEIGVKTFYIAKLLDDPTKTMVMFKFPEKFYMVFLKILKLSYLLEILDIFMKVQK